MLRSSEMRARNRLTGKLSRSFEPVMYEVQAVFDPRGRGPGRREDRDGREFSLKIRCLA